MFFFSTKKNCVVLPKKRFFLLDGWPKMPDPVKNYDIAGHPAVSG
jgi:hypothetical protein